MDDEEDFEESTTFTWVNFKFKTIRMVDNIFTATVNNLKAEVITDADATERDINIAMEKIHFWFDQIVSNSIMANRENAYAIDILFDANGLPRTQNFPMLFPCDPSDDNVVRVMHSKLNALGNEKLGFGMLELTSDTRELLTCTFTGWGADELPPIEEWVGPRTFYAEPWWSRNDGSTLDVIPSPESDLTKPPQLGIDMSFIEDRFKKTGNDQPATIVRPQFKPEVIPGGKNDNDKPKN